MKFFSFFCIEKYRPALFTKRYPHTIKKNEKFQRPIIYLNNWHGLNALLDTGALFPVWTTPEEALIRK